MRHRRSLLAVAAVISLLVVVVPRVSAGAEQMAIGNDNAADPGAFQHAAQLRAAAGLRADTATVAESYASSAYSDRSYGIPLSSDEASAFGDVLAAQSDLLQTVTVAMDHDGVVGTYFVAGALHVVLSRDDQQLSDELVQMSPPASDIVFETGPYSRAQLASTASSVAKQIGGPIAIKSISVDAASDRVRIGVWSDLDKARNVFASQYGDIVNVVHQDQGQGGFLCDKNDCGTKGGLTMHKMYIGDHICTLGFIAKLQNTSTHYLLTAGHCATASGGLGGLPWSNGADTITWGTTANYELNPSGGQDMAAVSLGGVVPPAWNQYFNGSVSSITGHVSTSGQIVGLIVCRYGIASGWGCGSITCRVCTFVIDGTTYHDVWEVQLTSNLGDSGAGFVHDAPKTRLSLGILSSGDSRGGVNYTYYYPPEFGIGGPAGTWWPVVCTSATC